MKSIIECERSGNFESNHPEWEWLILHKEIVKNIRFAGIGKNGISRVFFSKNAFGDWTISDHILIFNA